MTKVRDQKGKRANAGYTVKRAKWQDDEREVGKTHKISINRRNRKSLGVV